jgi:hypothetical protein
MRAVGTRWDAAIDDCTEALVLNPHLSKAYYRRAVARKSAGGPTKLEGARKGELSQLHGAGLISGAPLSRHHGEKLRGDGMRRGGTEEDTGVAGWGVGWDARRNYGTCKRLIHEIQALQTIGAEC